MGTPFITFLGPSDLAGYNRTKPYSEQPSHIPKTFLDAMEVREQVFVEEQKVPLNNEFDSDDPRACHWVVYASVNEKQPEETGPNGSIVTRKKSVTTSLPIGTIRLVPFPHPPHPEPGSSYAADALETSSPTSKTSPFDPPPFILDRATTFHDGKEPYIKLGRLALLKEFRGSGIARMLVGAAMSWVQANPTYFNPSIEKLGMEKVVVEKGDGMPVWKGLVCVHAQEQAKKVWTKWGFELDEKMGGWDEESIPHVGMFRRLVF